MSTRKGQGKARLKTRIRPRVALAEKVRRWSGDFEEEKALFSELIVAYCNETEIWASESAEIRELAAAGAGYLTGLDAIVELLRAASYFHFPKGVGPNEAAKELQAARLHFSAALRWLCSTKNPKSAVSAEELEKLSAKDLERGRFPDIDETSERFVAYFERHGLKHFQNRLALENSDGVAGENSRLAFYFRPLHVIDLFCAFLVKECRDREPSSMPIKVCNRCDKFFSTHALGKARTRKRYCSAKCQRGTYWTRERRSDYRYVERLDPHPESSTGMYSHPDLRKRLKKTKVKARLQKIKARWADWQRLQDKLAYLRAFEFGTEA